MTAERQTQEFQLEITDDARTALQQVVKLNNRLGKIIDKGFCRIN